MVARTLHHISLELELAGDSLTGRTSDGTHPAKTFDGWLGLMGAIDALVAQARVAAGEGRPDTSGPESPRDQGEPMTDDHVTPHSHESEAFMTTNFYAAAFANGDPYGYGPAFIATTTGPFGDGRVEVRIDNNAGVATDPYYFNVAVLSNG